VNLIRSRRFQWLVSDSKGDWATELRISKPILGSEHKLIEPSCYHRFCSSVDCIDESVSEIVIA
jgi:hypothetical protein